VDDIRAELDANNDALEGLAFGPRDWPFGQFVLDRFCILPCSTELFDVKGNALCVEQYGHWPADRLRDVTPETYVRWQLYCLEHKSMQLEKIAVAMTREEPPLQEGWGEIVRLCTVFDMTGLTFSHMLLPGGFKMVKQLIPLAQKYYPWLQDTTHLTNTSTTIYSFWHMLKPFLPAHTRRKIFIYCVNTNGDPDNGNSELTKHVRTDFLPAVLGGRAPCAALTPPPTVDEYDERQRRQKERDTTNPATTTHGPPSLMTLSSQSEEEEDDEEEYDEDAAWRVFENGDDPAASQVPPLRAWSSVESCDTIASEPNLSPPASPPASTTTDGLLSPTGRVLREHLAAGGKTIVVKHSRRRTISQRYLTCSDGLLKLTRIRRPSGLWRRSSSRTVDLQSGVCVARGQADSPQANTDLDQWQRNVLNRAARVPPNYVVIGTKNNKLLVLEFDTDEEATIVAAHLLAAAIPP